MPGTVEGIQMNTPVEVVWTGQVQITKQDGKYGGSATPLKFLSPDLTDQVRANLQHFVDELNGAKR